MAIISHIKIDNAENPIASNNMLYGVCSTAAATAAKTVTISDSKFTLQTGATIVVKFTITNTAANPTLNVDGTGAKAIYYNGTAITAGYLKANKVYEFIYNGTQWDLVGDSGFATVATSGSYNDLKDQPTIPTVNNGTLTIQQNNTTVKTFTANSSSNVIANITVPTKVSELTNDSGFTTASGHTHDGSYYKKSEIDTKLTNKLDAYIFTGTYTENGDSTYSVTLNDSYSWDDMAAAINANRYVSCVLLDEDGVHPLYFTLGGIYIDDSYVTFNSIDECYQVWELYIDRGGQFGLGTEHLAVQSNDFITVADIDEICGASITMITEDGEVEF